MPQSNMFDDIRRGLMPAVTDILAGAGDSICNDMRRSLSARGHVETGDLIGSIRYETEEHSTTADMLVYADATSADGYAYADAIEHGTGAAHGRPGGRQGYWRYKDAQGNWHTTDGQDADPFIAPAGEAAIAALPEDVSRGMDLLLGGV